MTELAPQTMARSAVLIVEDEAPICELIADILEAEGFEPVCVNRDEEAFDALRERAAFACVVVDVNLRAGMTGYDVARFARTLDPALPVVFVSGESTEKSIQANGVEGSLFVPKPFTADELMAKVHMLVGDNDDRPAG
jgi:DNA-binding response OmpR family regulator